MKVEHVRDYVVERLPYALNPRSIAVVGASRYTTKVGYKVIEGLKNWGYQGKIYPVNPRTSMMHGMKAYPRVCDIPDEVDLVFIAVPAHIVKSVLEDCVKKEAKIVVIATSAFKEIGRGELQNELTQYCRDHKLPLIGPNLVGMGSPYLNFNCGFIPYLPKKGPVAMISQSGANLLAALGTSQKDHFGMSFFVGLGNKADVDFCECIVANYMDEGSRVVFNHNFEEDILATANNIAKRYRCNRNHVEQTAYFALKIFDVVRKPFGLDKMQRLQLQIAALLHECGNFINLHDGARNSYYIVANTEILGLSHKERMEVANVVKYNPLYLPSKDKISAELDGCDYIVIAKLAAILRIANILDKSHMQKIEDISVTLKDGKLIILAKTYEDISLEAGLFEARADFFEQIYGIRPVLRVKRSV